MPHDDRKTARGEGEHPSASGARADEDLPHAPSPPAALTVDGANAATVAVSWSAPPDAGASGVDRYDVTVDGTKRGEAAPGTRRAAITDLAPDTTYDIGVAAVDEEGEVSPPARTEVTTATATGEDRGDDGDSHRDGHGRPEPSLDESRTEQ
ncbi:fibronectin type III domain-containing protein [Halosimplex sp. TS25]|uniref:fibronectin type III domain-containing protein n=1 Tax=Halosimplex rarum TaxID=3396619 RepID=UPI0039E7D57D